MRREEIPIDERLIFALDFDSGEKAREWVERLGGQVKFFKVGLQLFLAAGFPMVEFITRRGYKVMLDLKFYDVPETVKLAVRQLRDRGVSLTTVHGNDPILTAAAEAKGDVRVLAVTLLTSFGETEAAEFFGRPVDIGDYVYQRARRALEAGCDGVVCSGLEAKRLREGLGGDLLIVTPGIRPATGDGAPKDDQRRIVTAREAIANGADHIVVGRPISKAEDPLAVVELIKKQIAEGLSA